MKIAIIGYGRMGQTIEKMALEAGHEVVLKTNDLTRDKALLLTSEVAIEFSTPAVAVTNIITCIKAGIPVVSGTTAWLAKGQTQDQVFGEVASAVKEHNGSFFYSSNFSLGVNIFFELNQYLAKMMGNLSGYTAHLTETHHIHKLDAPSGTAITLANDLINLHPQYQDYQLGKEFWPEREGEIVDEQKMMDLSSGKVNANQLPITAIRQGETPGTHRITYQSSVDDLFIEHKAHGRQGFAKGALAAAEWLPGHQGIFGMNDLLNLR